MAGTKNRKFGYYWLVSERSSLPSIAQFNGNRWFLIGESEPVHEAELNVRGWEVGPRVRGQNRQYPKGRK